MNTARVVVVSGLPSRLRLAVSVIAAVGVMSLLCALVFAIAGAVGSSSPWMAPVLFVYMIVFWGPATWWSAWWISVPAVLVGSVVGALVTHRYRLPARDSREEGSAWRRGIIRACAAVILVCGAWSLALGAFFLLTVIQGA
jgi:hypothetical protein